MGMTFTSIELMKSGWLLLLDQKIWTEVNR